MDRLWTPWRYNYITSAHKAARAGVPDALSAWPLEYDLNCVFCNLLGSVDYAIASGMPEEEAEKSAHLLVRGRFCFLCLNAFPYSSGHVLIVPYRHGGSLAKLEEAAGAEMMSFAQQLDLAYQSVYRPDGMNLGMNLGEAAGAGVAGHLHLHTLPRWFGDTNFMTTTAETRILPETLDVTWERLRAALQHLRK